MKNRARRCFRWKRRRRSSDFDVVAFSISFETDYLNMAKMLQMSNIPVWAKERNHFHPLVVMGGAASFLNPEPIADFTDVIAVGEGEILALSTR